MKSDVIKGAKIFLTAALCTGLLLALCTSCSNPVAPENAGNGSANPQKPEIQKSSEKQLIEFKLEAAYNPGLAKDVIGNINQLSKNVTLIVPHGTDVTKLKPTFVVSKGASVFARKVLQQSTITENNFKHPFRFYKVVAEDGSAQEYMVQIEAAPASGQFTGKMIGAFDFKKDVNPNLSQDVFGIVGTIRDPQTFQRKNVVVVQFPIGTAEATIKALKPTFTASLKAKVFSGGTELKSEETVIDFYNLENGVNITVKAENGDTAVYNVPVEIDLPKANQNDVKKYFGSYKGTVPGLGEVMVVLAWDRVTLYSATMSMYYENMEWEKKPDNTYTCTVYTLKMPQIKNLYGKTGYNFTEEDGVLKVTANIMGVSTTVTKQATDFVWTEGCGYKKAVPR
ncbi:MAG: hypothetical protein ACFNKF_00615 [Treponema lecithinolyticum]|uniref:hypothetical protein n=1 Tax=Treponema lecithinolyticum TaxID=53418 RepID=UPI00360FD7B4